jgi:competence protein ComFA
MIEKPYFVYEAFNAYLQDSTGQHRFTGVSHYPLLDLKVLSQLGYSNLAVIAGPMPLAWAMHEADKLKRRSHPLVPGQNRFMSILGALSQALRPGRIAAGFDTVTLCDCRHVILPGEEELETLAETLRGRILFDREIRDALVERGHYITGNLHDILQTLILKGVIGRVPSVAIDRFGIPSCRRCGNPDVVQASCSSCSRDKCFYCPECASMGQARACRPLYYSPRDTTHLQKQSSNPNATALAFEVNLPFELTAAQKHASQLVTDFLEDSSHSECLVFAVCGAGKTEVVFQGIAHVLRHGGKVLFAIPRLDVVAEVVPRIASAMPDARILELRGGAKSRYRDSDIVVATTHQTIRFFRAFDLVVLDEVDAFPYRGSAILNYAVKRATAHHGNTVFMTATPNRELLRKTEQNEIALVRLSARHHGRPLPEPEIIRTRLPLPEARISLPDKTGSKNVSVRLPDKVIAVIECSLEAGRKMFIFVPTVALSHLICMALPTSLRVLRQPPSGQPIADSGRTLVKDSLQPRTPRIASIHASHPNRELHREAFRTGTIDIIVSTSVLERGITVPNADVLVLYADYERIFDTATLIQMAGRAGRTKGDTQAKVYFAGRQVTASMRAV